MSWSRSEKLIAEHPEWRKEIQELASVLQPGKEYSFAQLLKTFGSMQPETLSAILAELTARGAVQRVMRLESPETHGGIEDYSSLLDVPDEIFDWRTQHMIHVLPEYIVPIFRVVEAV